MLNQTLYRTLLLTVSGIIAAFVLAASLLVAKALPSTTTNVCALPNQLIAMDDFTYEGDDIVVDGCAGIIEGVHSFNSLMVVNSGLLRHRTGITTGMRLTITNDVLVEAGSTINVAGRGYAGGPANGTAEGPGAGIGGDGHGGGGGHGGHGAGLVNFFGEYSNAGLAYGDLYRPVTSGSGGAGCQANAFCSGSGGTGGNGGGVVVLNVGGTLTVDGNIIANGNPAVSVPGIIPGSGGAGGSIWLTADVLAGSGPIHARGGNGAGAYNRMGGGGGRIAVYYGSSSFTGEVSARAGQTSYMQGPSSSIFAAGAGTIYLRDVDEAAGHLQVINRALESAALPPVATTPLDGGMVTAAEPHNLTYFDIQGSALVGTDRPVTVTNGSSFAPGLWAIQGVFDGVTTTVGAGISISHTLATTGTTTLYTSRFDGLLIMDAAADLRVGRGIWLEVQTPLSLDEVWIGNGGRLGHVAHRDGISPTLTLVANSVTVAADGQIDASARGFAGAVVGSNAAGGGPGGGLAVGEYGSGAGHGGPGGGPGGGGTYGSATLPTALGSGGSAGINAGGASGGNGGRGGGRIHLIVDGPLVVDGRIKANGGNTANEARDGGGGSGGSIWIQATSLAGGGVIRAHGGSGWETGGGGGGGRIAIDVVDDTFVGIISANGGSGATNGSIGSIEPENLFGVAQFASPTPASYGGELVYTLQVSNNATAAITATITNTFSAAVAPSGQQSWTTAIGAGETWSEMVTVTVAANAADPVVNLLEASVAGQVRSVTLQTPLEDIPVSGLTAENDSPTLDGSPVNFNAAVTAGSNVVYDWNFGDGATGSGSFADHVYDAPGIYTATVTAANSRGSEQASTIVTVEPLPNFRGTVFEDIDGDGLQGVDESGLPGVLMTAAGPAGSLTDTTASNGSWRIDSGDAGVYIIVPSLNGYTSTSDAPVQVALPSHGSTYVNFGLAPVPAPGAGAILGRAFADSNGNGAFDAAESGFSGVTVTLFAGGAAVDTTATAADGSYSFPNIAPGLYAVAAAAPAAFFPATLLNEDLSVAAGQVASAQFGFVGGGELVGTVRNGGGYPVSGITLVLTQEDAPAQTAVTDSDGEYVFLGLGPGTYGLAIELPAAYQLPDGQDTRQLLVLGDTQTVEDWVVNRQGRVYVRAFLDNQIPFVPVGGATFVISGTNGFSATVSADGNGQAIVDGLSPGAYIVTPQLDPDDGFSVSPQQRVVEVALDGSAFLDFFFDFPRTIRALCQRATGSAAGPAFPCIVTATVISGTAGAPGSVVDTIQLNGERTALFTNLDAGTYRITITPDSAVAGQALWPVHEEIVALNDGDNRVVDYPYNPTAATTRIWGYAFYDRNQNGARQDFGGTMFSAQDEAHDNAANGMVVSLYDAAGTLVMTTTTGIHGQYGYGWYAFDGVPAGDYIVEISLRSGLFATTAPSAQRTVDAAIPAEPAHFGYIKQFGSHIGGLVFYDNNGNGEPDPEIDDPLGGVELILRDAGGADVDTTTSNAYGSYTFYPLPSGEYTVVLIAPEGSDSATTLAHPVAVPNGDSAVTLHYALPPDDGRTRAIVYIDQNFNEEPDDEEAMSGVVLHREPGNCNNLVGPSGNGVAAVSDGDGLALFPPVSQSGCVTVDRDSLPPGVAPAQQALLAAGGSGFVWVRLLPAGTVNISPFWDKDGDGSRDPGEPVVAGATVTIAGDGMQPVGASGATFSLAEGNYAATVNPPGNMTVAAPMPLTVVATSGGSSAYDVPLRYTGQVAGVLLSSGGSPTWANLQVILEDLQNGSLYFATISQSDSYYQFNNLQPSTYRLRLANVPSGWALASEPTFGYLAGLTVNQNLTLLRLGSVSGEVFLDQNGNGVRDSGEPATGQYDVTLTNNAGQPDVTVDVAADGTFAVPNLVPGVQYAVTSDLGWGGGGGAPGSAITAAPGWFIVDSSGASVSIGIYPYAYDPEANDYNTVFGRVYEQIGTVKNPHAGAVISYWTWSQGSGCSVVNGVLGTAVSDNDGYYRILTDWIPDTQKIYCIQVTELPGMEQNQLATAPFSFYYQSTSGMVFYPGIRERDLIVSPSGSFRSVSAPSLSWHAFRDDNGNGIRDGQEPALPDVVVGNGTISNTTDINGDGLLTGLPSGEQLLAVVAPDGYVPASGSTFSVWLDGADIALGGLPFRLDGWLSGSLFGDADGDGHRAAGELGIGNVTITFSGPLVTSTVTALDGSFALPNLPDGTYQVTLTPPAGFAPLLAQSISLESGGALQLPLRPIGLVGGVVYQDWDGDGRRLPDEDLVSHPLTMTLSNGATMLLAGGKFLFWDLVSGSYTVTPLWSAVLPATVDTATGGVVALPVVPGGTVRGTVWHDVNGDGLRQPSEVPLGGVLVSVAGQDGMTDAIGRFQFLNVVTGTHTVSVTLPGSLEAELDQVTVSGLRGAVVGVAAAVPTTYTLFLPVVVAGGGQQTTGPVQPSAPVVVPPQTLGALVARIEADYAVLEDVPVANVFAFLWCHGVMPA